MRSRHCKWTYFGPICRVTPKFKFASTAIFVSFFTYCGLNFFGRKVCQHLYTFVISPHFQHDWVNSQNPHAGCSAHGDQWRRGPWGDQGGIFGETQGRPGDPWGCIGDTMLPHRLQILHRFSFNCNSRAFLKFILGNRL